MHQILAEISVLLHKLELYHKDQEQIKELRKMAQQARFMEGANKGNLIEYLMKTGHGVKGLSETEMGELPEQYIQPESERPGNMKIMEESCSIPIIDVSKWEDPSVVTSVCDAAQKWGFFQIINHGVPLEVLENVKQATLMFFRLTPEEKKKYLKENSPSNHVRLSTSFIPDAENSLEWKDYLSLFYVSEHEALSIWPIICRYYYSAYP